ncbi:MAG: class I SAM-dependent methyltransferase [Patescibacteria group bacterium]
MQKSFYRKRQHIETSWDESAQWYHGLVGEKGMELQRAVVFPQALRLLHLQPHERLLDVACGQGAFCREAVRYCREIAGIDASPQLIALARNNFLYRNSNLTSKETSPHIPSFVRRGGGGLVNISKKIKYYVGDARKLPKEVVGERFDAISCILAISNIDPIKPVFEECKKILKPSGRLVLVVAHPCFRIPRQSGWGWDEQRKLQYRRVDRYLSEMKIPIQMHPGGRSHEVTWTFHRPLGVYMRALTEAGFAVDAMEEWTTNRKSTPGPRARADMNSKQEIPLFLTMRAISVNVKAQSFPPQRDPAFLENKKSRSGTNAMVRQ